jgi:nucleotide-binding universal stress UspA family protein
VPRKFLVVVDDTPEFETALRFAARRARSTGGRVALLRVLPDSTDEHWSGVRDEIEREQRAEAEALLSRLGDETAERSGAAPLFLIEKGEPQAAIRKVVGDDPEIKILVLAAGTGSRGPGPLAKRRA